MLNVKVDRRHDRRALSADEFARLVEAAMFGPPVVCLPGHDRAMMYVLAAWTGYRKAEISSLTMRSIQLEAEPPTVTVAAAYSKRKRQDMQAAPRGGEAACGMAENQTRLGAGRAVVPRVGKDSRCSRAENV
jgi:integrase